MRFLLSIVLIVVAAIPAHAASDRWVNSDRLMRRTCPSTDCGVVGYLFFREKVDVLEQKNGWARITRFYDASCRNGASEYVEKGNGRCDVSNGFVDGKFAEWVSADFLVAAHPAEPAKGATGLFALVQGSNDYRLHKDAFAKAAEVLISSGVCTAHDFKEMGGWLKSTTTFAERPVYFTYCGGITKENRIYLDVKTGEIFQ